MSVLNRFQEKIGWKSGMLLIQASFFCNLACKWVLRLQFAYPHWSCSNEVFVQGHATWRNYIIDAMTMEVLALKKGVQLAKQRGY
jgi:hypothetical protein